MAQDKIAALTKDDPLALDSGLPTMHGWAKLSEAKQKRATLRASNIKKFGGMEGLMSVNGGLELADQEADLEGEVATITDFIKTIYGSSERTGWRKLKTTKKLKAKWPPDLIRAIAERGSLLLRGTAGIQIGDLLYVADELPAPKKLDDKTIDAFIEGPVREKLKEHKSLRRKGKSIRISKEDGTTTLFNFGNRIFKAMKLENSADVREVIETVGGWWMQNLALRNSIELKRVTIPDDAWAKVGRPRKKGPTKNAA